MNNVTYRDRITAGWLGKCLGGAIGMPYEGVPYPVELTETKIAERMQDVPNDDLELQLVWMAALKRHGLSLNSEKLSQYWLNDIRHGCDEYSIAIRNLSRGIMPPLSGWCDNFFADGMGAAIRSEIWAMLFPDYPTAAVHFAALDASVDHWGDGVFAEELMAAAESMAFASADAGEIFERALDFIPEDCRLARAIRMVIGLFRTGTPEEEAAEIIRKAIDYHNFTDCVMNVGHTVFALLYGRGDFLRTMRLCISFGRDTDCSAASCGAFLGIMHGTAVIPRSLRGKVADTLTLSAFVHAIAGTPRTMTALVDETEALHRKLFFTAKETCYSIPHPFVPPPETPKPNAYLVLDPAKDDVAAIEAELRAAGACPAHLRNRIVPMEELVMNLSEYATNANTLDLFAFLEVGNRNEPAVLSVTADTGFTLWIDGVRLVNCHNRQRMIPSFHRAEGGAAFRYEFRPGPGREIVHLRLYSCIAPLRAALMFGNEFNDHRCDIRISL